MEGLLQGPPAGLLDAVCFIVAGQLLGQMSFNCPTTAIR